MRLDRESRELKTSIYDLPLFFFFVWLFMFLLSIPELTLIYFLYLGHDTSQPQEDILPNNIPMEYAWQSVIGIL